MLNIDSIVNGILDVKYSLLLVCVVVCFYTKNLWLLICPIGFFTFHIFCIINNSYTVPKLFSLLLEKDVAIITGGSNGLGYEMVKLLALKYNLKHVYVIDICEPHFESTNVSFFKCNVGDKEALLRTLKQIVKECDKLDQKLTLFISNAGVRHSKSLLHLDDQEIENLYNVNLFSFIWGVRFLINNHIQTNSNGKFSVVTVSSVLGHLAPKNLTIYSSSKAALTQAHQGLAEELSDFPNIRMLLVKPGQLLNGMFDDVKPTKVFFAPVVNHVDLAHDILNSVNKGECGVLRRPLYATFLPLVNCLPYSLERLCRWYSEMDKKVEDN